MTANPQGPVRVVPVPYDELADFAHVIGDLIAEVSDPGTGALAAHYRIKQFLAAAPSPAAPEGVEGWREIAEYSGCGPVLVSTAPESPKYLASDPVTAFKDAVGVWRCLGSVGGCEPLALQPTHFAPMPKRPTLPPVPLADGGR